MVAGGHFQRTDRRVHDLVDNAASQRFDGHFLFWRHLTETSTYAVNLRLPDSFKMVVQRDNRRDNVERLQADLKLLDFAIDDGFGFFGLLLAICNVAGHRFLQVVDVIHEDAVKPVHLWVNIAGYGDVDEKHGPVFAPRQKLLTVLALEDKVGRSGRCNHDVRAFAGFVEPAELYGLTVEFMRQTDGTIVGAIRDKN